MNGIRINGESYEYQHDCERIQRIFREHDLLISLVEARILWDKYSYSFAAGWLMMDEMTDEAIFISLGYYYEIGDEIA